MESLIYSIEKTYTAQNMDESTDGEIPQRWADHVALERLDCREFFTDDNWITYDTGFDDQQRKRIRDASVLITGLFTVFDDVDPISIGPTAVRGMAGGYFEPVGTYYNKSRG